MFSFGFSIIIKHLRDCPLEDHELSRNCIFYQFCSFPLEETETSRWVVTYIQESDGIRWSGEGKNHLTVGTIDLMIAGWPTESRSELWQRVHCVLLRFIIRSCRGPWQQYWEFGTLVYRTYWSYCVFTPMYSFSIEGFIFLYLLN